MELQESQQTTGPSNTTKIAVTVAVLLVAVLLVVGIKAFAAKDETTNNSTQSATADTSGTTTSETSSSADEGTNTYKDGTYSATGDYSSPGGSQEITVSVTLKDGTITETSATEGASDGQSSQFQEQFISGYKSLVVGKSIDEVKLSRVSGSSLTSQGFNDAIDAIKDQAKS